MPYKKKERALFQRKKPRHKKLKTDKIKQESEPDTINELGEEKQENIKKQKTKQSKPKSRTAKKKYMLVGIIVLAVLLVFSAVFCVLYNVREQKIKEAAALDALPRIVVPEGFFEPVSYEYTFLKSMKAIKLTPKVDLYADIAQPQAELEKEIDAIIANIKTLNFNSVVIDTKYDNKVIFASEYLEATPIDVLSLLVNKAKAEGISVVAVFHATNIKNIEGELLESHISYESKAALFDAAAELAKNYELDSILIDDYYVQKNASSYAEFKNYGGVGDYEEWLIANTYATVEGIAQSIKATRNSLATGLYVDSVWQNKEQDENGSNTKAEFCALRDGYADTKAMIQDKIIDFINVKIPTSIDNQEVCFSKVVEWWSKLCKDTQTPLYITHSAENANSKELVGWAGTDQLAKQVLAVMKNPTYNGSAFSGLKDIMANIDADKSIGILLSFYKNEYSEKDLLTNLQISLPTKRQFVTYEENVQFRGKFDPNQEVLLNGNKVNPTERGGFSVWVPLDVGKNTITLEHKGITTTYQIERKVVILQSVSPTKAMKVAGGSIIEFNVMAYKGSKITASINGTTVTLQEGGAGEDNVLDSAYKNFQGTYRVPASKNKEQNIGKITFKGLYQGYTETLYSGNITIDKIPDQVDPDAATGQMFTHAVVNMAYANTYPYLTTSGYPQAVLYQLPYGTQDIVQSTSGNFVHLRSGKTVHRDAVTFSDIPFEGNNAITAMSAGVEGSATVLRATFSWKAPFSLTPSPYPTEPASNSYQFGSDRITLLFDYTTFIDEGVISSTIAQLSSSPLFSGASFERVRNESLNIYQYKLTLNLSRAGRYYGCHAWYEDNTLVLRFNNPPPYGTLSGLTIAVDPGHGGSDNGTMAGSDTVEKTVNMIVAQKVMYELQSLGANVIMTRYDDTNPSLAQRVQFAHNNRVDMFISVHHNSAGANTTASGVETFFNAPFSQPLAHHVQQQLAMYMNNRGAKSYNFFVAREKQFPSILIEYGFLSNPSEEQLILDSAHQDNMARATAQGVLNYYNSLG